MSGTIHSSSSSLVFGFVSVVFLQVACSATVSTDVYAVLLKNLPPSTAFEGNELFARTSPYEGKKLQAGSSEVQRYVDHLESLHKSILLSLGIDSVRKLYSYKHVLNAFAISLSPSEVAVVESHPEVGAVVKSHHCFKQTSHTPKFLNIPKTLWKQVGGVESAGEDIIIGVIDTGINPDHPSFSDQIGPPYKDIHLVKSWRGNCFLADKNFTCNKKLIGAKFFVSGILAEGDTVDTTRDLYSPRDFNGHGSHTASTAGGNHGIPLVIPGTQEGSLGVISGMAPRARIAAYKGLWFSGKKYPGGDYGTVVDLLAALEEAVSDGVDVINYSIGPSDDFFDIWALGVLYAARAGVFVTASAGNSGPGPVTLGHVAPWYLSVAASTHDREYTRVLTLGNGVRVQGEGLLVPLPQKAESGLDPFSVLSAGKKAEGVSDGTRDAPLEAPLISGAQAAISVDKVDQAEFCLEGSLNPELTSGAIVLCKRGFNGRVEKEKVVSDAGGVGLVLWNDSPQGGLVTDLHFIPALHVTFQDGQTVLAYLNSSDKPRGEISSQITLFDREAPAIIDFSSRGPVADPKDPPPYPLANDILKPDVAAPGVSIWAGFAPGGDPRQLSFNLLSGTSMASPHIAGIAALLRQIHPLWSPFWIKSAIQTSANVLDNRGRVLPGSPPAVTGNPFDFGSGQVVPANASDPGLIFPSGFEEYIGFLYFSSFEKALALSGVPPPRNVTLPRDLNTPNIAVSNLSGTVTVRRTILSVATRGVNVFRAEVVEPEGVGVEVEPKSLVVPFGEKRSFLVTFSVKAPSSEFKFGTLKWTNGEYCVTSQLAVQPLSVG